MVIDEVGGLVGTSRRRRRRRQYPGNRVRKDGEGRGRDPLTTVPPKNPEYVITGRTKKSATNTTHNVWSFLWVSPKNLTLLLIIVVVVDGE